MRNRKLMVAAAVLTVLAAREARGDIYHLKSPSSVKTEKGNELKLPPGYFLDEQTWQDRDLEMKKLQEQRTRLTAENKSLRESVGEHSWLLFGTAGAIGIVVGVIVMAAK